MYSHSKSSFTVNVKLMNLNKICTTGNYLKAPQQARVQNVHILTTTVMSLPHDDANERIITLVLRLEQHRIHSFPIIYMIKSGDVTAHPELQT